MSIFSSFGFRWPYQLTSLFNAASTSSFNQQLLAPECSVGSVGFAAKWFILQATPLVFIVGLVVLLAVDSAWVRMVVGTWQWAVVVNVGMGGGGSRVFFVRGCGV